MQTDSRLNSPADFYDVYAGAYDQRRRVRRFTGTERGFLRAKEYAREFNASLLKALGLTEDDLGMVDRGAAYDGNNPEAYEKYLRTEQYNDHRAVVRGAGAIPVVGDDDPMPTDYPHEF